MRDNMILGMVSALPDEAETLLRVKPVIGNIYSLGAATFLAVAGSGEASARAAAEDLLSKGVGALLSWGVAAGLQPGLMPGDILMPKLLVMEGGDYQVNVPWHSALKKRLAPYARVDEGSLTHAGTQLVGLAAKQALYHRSTAVAVDGESVAIAAVAKRAKVPFLVLKVIVDPAELSWPAALQGVQHNCLNLSGLLAVLGLKPWCWRTMLRLNRCSRLALATLQHIGERLEWDFMPPVKAKSSAVTTDSGQ